MCRVGHRGSGICYCLKYLSLPFLSACYDEIRSHVKLKYELQVRQSDSKFVIANFSSSTSSSSTSSWDKLRHRLDWNLEGPADAQQVYQVQEGIILIYIYSWHLQETQNI